MPSSSESEQDYDEPQQERLREPLSLVKDPLSEVTRKERRTLLGASAIGVAMVKANLLPQKISTLGIDFQQIDQTVLLRSVAFLILYFILAFLLYSTSDFLTWRIAYRRVVEELAKNRDTAAGSGPSEDQSLEKRRSLSAEGASTSRAFSAVTRPY